MAILADSLALPRPPEAGNILFEQTYPYLVDEMLRAAFPQTMPVLIERGQRFRTIGRVLEDWTECVDYRNPDFVVIHVGIVDCAPRVFSPGQRYFVERFLPGFLRNTLLTFVHEYRNRLIRKRQNVVYTPLDEFARGVSEVVVRSVKTKVRRLFLVNILTPSDDLEARSPGYKEKVHCYNNILRDIALASDHVELVDFDGMIRIHGGTAALTVDGMHPKFEGNQLLARALVARISEIMKEPLSGG